MEDNLSLTIVIPAYNEGEDAREVLESVCRLYGSHEIILVDDGSTDETGEIASTSDFRVIRHPYNKGYGAALKAGIRQGHGEYILTMDADGQHQAEDIPLFLSELPGFDMVVGCRQGSSGQPVSRAWGKRLLGLVANYLAETRIPDLNSGFRLFKRELALGFMSILPDSFSFTTTLTLAFLKEGFNVKYIPVKAQRRTGSSRSTVSVLHDGPTTFLLILRTILLFNPLKVFLPVSVVLFLLGFSYLMYQLIFFTNVPDSSILLIMSSLLIFFFGLLADQLSHLRRQMK